MAQAQQASQTQPKHVLLISVDGLHAQDLSRYVAEHPGSALAKLSGQGTSYLSAHTTSPSDSFPGMLALVTGGTPKSTGVYYDDSYDRQLAAPGSDCKTPGTEVVFDESVDANTDALDGGGHIDPAKLPRDPANNCQPVMPHSFVRVNNIFNVAKGAGLYTAWSDKHLAYDLLRGPDGKGIDDLYTPEINSAGGITDNEKKTAAYDALKVKAILNQIAGKTSGSKPAQVPAIFGMNFQALSVAQKTAGYKDAWGTPTADVAAALDFVNQSVGQMQDALKAKGLANSTVTIITAKHGQSPVDPALRRVLDSKALQAAIDAAAPGQIQQLTLDTIGLLWMKDGQQADAVAKALLGKRQELAINHILSGEAVKAQFGDPASDSRVPDLVIVPEVGVIYTKPSATKVAEHGGFSEDDTHVALLVSGAGVGAGKVTTPVTTTQVAPTILTLLGLDPSKLQAVGIEHTQPLPRK